MMPPLNLNARVVVPWAILMGQLGLLRSSVMARSHDEAWTLLDLSMTAELDEQGRTYLVDWRKGEFEG